MDPNRTRPLGATGIRLPQLGFGAAPLGELFSKVSEAAAEQTLTAAWDAGIRYFDTAPWYGRGQSEHRVGRFLYRQPRRDFVLSTKIGRILRAPAVCRNRDIPLPAIIGKAGPVGGRGFRRRQRRRGVGIRHRAEPLSR